MIEIGFIFGLAIYGLVWFVVLFAVLPFGVVTQAEKGEVTQGSVKSAPAHPAIGKKLLITTIIAGFFYAIIYWLLTSSVLLTS